MFSDVSGGTPLDFFSQLFQLSGHLFLVWASPESKFRTKVSTSAFSFFLACRPERGGRQAVAAGQAGGGRLIHRHSGASSPVFSAEACQNFLCFGLLFSLVGLVWSDGRLSIVARCLVDVEAKVLSELGRMHRKKFTTDSR
ncbi:hypothetical protein CSUI_001836 [Cystoisospora suis]|uniref:Uncharacterized protein n=1 Tax=Cystoisospora suis TaxID=483139 RepID=A0A2C6LBK1_9APIC|nr:hypothetical protein CSUI_001836 [Cystoisospora suis]